MIRNTATLTQGLFRLGARTPFNIAPERGHELAAKIIGNEPWEYRLTGGLAQFYALPEEHTVVASSAGLASLWCLSYVAYHLMDIGRKARRQADPNATHIDISPATNQSQLNDYLNFARSLFHGDRMWPEGLQVPDADASIDSIPGRINNLFYGALAWILLHEIAHIHLEHQKFVPASMRVGDELAADRFATEWILSKAGQGIKAEFRVMVLSVSMAWCFLSELTLGTGPDHPPAIVRFNQCKSVFSTGDRSTGLECACDLFKAVFDPLSTPPAFDTPKAMFDWISAMLERRFTR